MVIALDLGELSIRLQLENDRFRQQMAATKRELEGLSPAAQREVVKVTRVFDEEGRKSGGVLARGINSGLVRNSPLIVAGIGAALAAGAPVMIAAAGTLFAGLGAVAAAQSLEVRAAWTELGRSIRDGAVADAAVLVPVYTEMAEEIGRAFQRMRPQLREAFADSAPLIDSFTDGIIALGENAMPGLVRAVSAAGPVFDGLEHFLAATGMGLTDFFDAISSHGPAAGSAFAALGDIMGELLPLLGELLGQGAELAADVLPAVAAATGLTLDVLQELGPLLPSIAAGFVAFKAAQAASGYLSTFSTSLATAGTNMGRFGWQGELAGVGVQKASGAVAAMGKALPAVGIALGLVAAVMARVDQQSTDWAEALAEGGRAAEAAKTQMADFGAAMEATNSGFEGFIVNLVGGAAPFATTVTALDDAETKASELEAAERELAATERELERQNAATELAIHGVTSAMIEQADQAMAALDSGFAYRNSLDALEDAQAALNTAIAEQGAGSEAAQRAQLGLEEQAYRTALAFGQQQADLTDLSSDSLEYKRIVQEEMLAELQRLHDAAGPEMKAAYAQQIAALQASGVAVSASANLASVLTGQVRGLSGSIHEVPGQKFVKIDAPTGPQIQQMKDLGYQVVTLPNGDVYVAADTADAEAALNYAARKRQSLVEQVFVQTNRPMTGAFAADGGALVGGRFHRYDGGGAVTGPGGPRDDLVAALGPDRDARYRLSNGEHIWTAREVRAAGGHGAIAEMRRAVLAGKGYAAGGPVAAATTAPAMAGRSTHITVEARTNDERRIAKAISERLRDDEFLAGT